MAKERRRSPRIQILGRVHGHVASLDVAVKVREMSIGGLSMETEFPFPIGAQHDFSLTLGDGASVHLTGQVVYSREIAREDGSKLWLTGVQFTHDESEAPAVDVFLDRLS
jgi:hypothetical protein